MTALNIEAEHLTQHYNYKHITPLDVSAAQALCPSPTYHGSYLDRGAGHLHPLAFALGCTRAAKAAGAEIYERSEVLKITEGATLVFRKSEGKERCNHAILTCNECLRQLNQKVAARVRHITNFIAAIEPLGVEAKKVLTEDIALANAEFVVHYFRLSHDRRLLFGGGENYSYHFPSDIAARVRRPILKIFPYLKYVRIDDAWGGTLAITARRMPYLTWRTPNMLSASSFSGHGVGTATLPGQLIALPISGQSEEFDTMSRMPSIPFPGGKWANSPILKLTMAWCSLRDCIGV